MRHHAVGQPEGLALGAAVGEGGIESRLAEAVRICPGIDLALLVDAEGVLVARYERLSGIDAEEVAAEVASAAAAQRRALDSARAGDGLETIAIGEQGLLVARRLERGDLLLVLRAAEQTWLGQLRFAARTLSGRLSDQLTG